MMRYIPEIVQTQIDKALEPIGVKGFDYIGTDYAPFVKDLLRLDGDSSLVALEKALGNQDVGATFEETKKVTFVDGNTGTGTSGQVRVTAIEVIYYAI